MFYVFKSKMGAFLFAVCVGVTLPLKLFVKIGCFTNYFLSKVFVKYKFNRIVFKSDSFLDFLRGF